MNEQLKEIRLSLGFSPSEWAKLLNVSVMTIYNWERAKNKPNALSQEKIFKTLERFNRQLKRVERTQI